MNQNNTLKNKIETKQLKKTYIKKICKNRNLNHDIRINPQKKLKNNHKINNNKTMAEQ